MNPLSFFLFLLAAFLDPAFLDRYTWVRVTDHPHQVQPVITPAPLVQPPEITQVPTVDPDPQYHPVKYWDEVYRFIQRDPTSDHEYIRGSYGCEEFALDLQDNLRAAGIYAYRVVIKFNGTDYGHIFVAIPTTDRGTVYIEPQDDFELEPPRVGEMFCYLRYLYPGACNPSRIITKVVEYP